MDGQRNNRWKMFSLVHHMHLLAIVYICVHAYQLIVRMTREKAKKIRGELKADNERQRDKLMYRLIHSEQCRDIIRMDARPFLNLCFLLEVKGGLKPSRDVGIHELVARFLYTIGNNEKHRTGAFFFLRGRATISRDFHKVMRALIELEQLFFKQPDGSSIPQEILNNDKFYPYFKDCVDAIDCTHVRARVSSKRAASYRGRKDSPTMNVLAACTFDLKFSYVLVGWEGTASDSRIIKNALSRKYPLKIPQGKYYLVDAGFMIKSGLIAPYRGERYHTSEYSPINPPQTPRELFNLRHASLRNAIERAFGVLKKRFSIIRTMTEPHYSTDALKKIILSCCILHNYLVDKDLDLPAMLAEVDKEIQETRYQAPGRPDRPRTRDEEQDSRRGEVIREGISHNMWRDYAI